MLAQEQHDLIAFLSDPASTHAKGHVEVIETHISRIFLAGDRAWKTKRAVRLPYVDFSTAEKRLAACEREIELNSATAPEIYVAAHRIVRRPDGRIGMDEDGKLIDGVVEMRRFDQERLLDRIAANGELTPDLMTRTARAIESFHRIAPVAAPESGAANMAGVLDINEAGFAECRLFDPSELRQFQTAMRAALARHSALLDRRSGAGKVRRCHGDLHLRNICLIDGEPRLFDCIEFNDRIATVDVLYDLAFLLMDLWHRKLPELANLVMNRYLDQADDEDGFPLLPFFMAVRAAVRAHVLGTQVAEGAAAADVSAEALAYFRLASSLLQSSSPLLVAIGGLSGSGKTTVAEALAPQIGAPPGARIVESDRIRKAMHGVPAETRLPQKAYRPEVSEKVYGEMAWRSALILDGGGAVVSDAVFEDVRHRLMIQKVAEDRDVRFIGIWLDAPPNLLWQRVSARRSSPSDATVDVLARQLDRNISRLDWQTIDAAQPTGQIVNAILAASRSSTET